MRRFALETEGPKSSQSGAASQHVSAIIRFIEWSQANTSLEIALEYLATSLKAEGAILGRLKSKPFGRRVAARYFSESRSRQNGVPLNFATGVADPALNDFEAGAVVCLSQLNATDNEDRLRLDKWMRRNGFCDAAFICLSKTQGERHFLELYYTRLVSPPQFWALEQISPDLARIFGKRRPGLITEALARQAVNLKPAKSCDGQILGPGNPAGLTRAELRVCVLVSRGLSSKTLSDELGVSRATVRTHLKHIYGKTGLENYHMLARRLVSLDERRAMYGGTDWKYA